MNVALAFSLRKSWRTGLPTDSGDGLECELASENRNASRRRRSVKSRTRGYGKFPSNLRAAHLSSPLAPFQNDDRTFLRCLLNQ